MRLDNQIEKLIDRTIYICPAYNSSLKLKDYASLLRKAINTIHYVTRNIEAVESDYYVLRKVAEDLLNNKPSGCISENHQIKELYYKLKLSMKDIPPVESKEIIEKPTDIDSLIRSLKIYKLDGAYLSENIYLSSYELYCDLREIILKRNSSLIKKLYVGHVTRKFSNIKSIDIKQEDYELFNIIRLTKDNPSFNYKSNTFNNNTYEMSLINTRFDYNEWVNGLVELEKYPKKLEKTIF